MTKTLKVILSVALIFAAILIAPYVKGEHGLVIIGIGDWMIEGSVSSVLLLALSLFVGAWLVLFVVNNVIRVVVLPSKWWQGKKHLSQGQLLENAVEQMSSSQWRAALGLLRKIKSDRLLSQAKQLAEICHAQLDYQEELPNHLLSDDQGNTANYANLLKLYKQQLWSDALKMIAQMPLTKQSVATQQLALATFARAFDWNEFAKHYAKLHKAFSKELPEQALASWQQELQNILSLSFDQYVQQHSINQLSQVWAGWHKTLVKDYTLQAAYINVMAKHKQLQLIEPVLMQNQAWNRPEWLLDVVRQIYINNSQVLLDQLFAKVQDKVSKDQENKTLLLIFAYLAEGHKDHQLAKQALEQSLYSSGSHLDQQLYAQVLAELGEVRHSLDVYRALPRL